MTFEELKEEAAKHGYRLVPMKAFEPLLPCTCGCNRRSTWRADSITRGELKMVTRADDPLPFEPEEDVEDATEQDVKEARKRD